ncbi:MAG: phosphotransferase [Lachnospiraceae bacterium]|nr:phosphotransferase [Lachnospiraceae bacterium]
MVRNLGIERSKEWEHIEAVDKGWSKDKKYKIITKAGEKQLLRISDIAEYDFKKREYEIITKYSKLGFNMSMPLEFGICNDNKNVYSLLSWIEGRDLEIALPTISEKEQYLLGRQAGKILKMIHGIPVDKEDLSENTKREKKLYQVSLYKDSENLRIPNDEIALKYVEDNINDIWKQKPVYKHGDFHPGNLIYMKDGSIGVIDFNRWEVGDPYEEFYKLESFGIEISVPYCIGQIDEYFNDNIPKDFWSANAVYVAHSALYSIKWAEKFGQEDIDRMVKRAKASLINYDGFRRIIPKWYDEKYREFYKG